MGVYYVHSDCDPVLLENMMKHYDGVIIAGTGSGNYPSAIKDVITNSEDCILVRSSRVIEGAVFDSKYFDPELKTVPALKFSPQKARILLQLSLLVTKDPEKIKDIFLTY